MFNLQLAGLALTGLLALGGLSAAGIGAAQAAQTATGEAAPLTAAHIPRGDRALRDRPVLLTPDERAAIVADALGLTVADLEAALADGLRLRDVAADQGVEMDAVADALRQALEDAVTTAEANGELTPEQADAIRERIALRATMRDVFGPEERLGALAEALGMTIEELEAARAAGTTLRDLVDAQGADPAAVRYALGTARDAAIDGALNDGLITPAQALRLRAGHRRPVRPLRPRPAPPPSPDV